MAKRHAMKEPFTGVGTPGPGAQAGGAELGGDTGDVGTPRTELGGSPGGTYGTSRTTEPSPSTRRQPGNPPAGTAREKQRRAA